MIFGYCSCSVKLRKNISQDKCGTLQDILTDRRLIRNAAYFIWNDGNNNDFAKSSKSPASIAKSNKQGVGTCLYQEVCKHLLINCEAVIWLWASSEADCEYPLDFIIHPARKIEKGKKEKIRLSKKYKKL